MERTLLHVYRNTPLGRETLLQSAFFCQKVGCELAVYVPEHPQFLLYLEAGVATVSLDSSYLRKSDDVPARIAEIADEFGARMEIVVPSGYTADDLPNVEAKHAFMACPRSMSELSSRIRFGHLGPRVRAIVKAASFPILLPTPVFKPWRSVVVCFGGSENAVRAAARARRLSRDAKAPLSVFTFAEGEAAGFYTESLERAGLMDGIRSGEIPWIFADSGTLQERLFDVPRDALVVAGAYGRGIVREALFGSKLEVIQTEVPNNLLIVGPNVS